MKSILLAVKPKDVEKIVDLEKTVLIRKTMPKCELPTEVYIYCTTAKEGNPQYIREGFKIESAKGFIVAKFTLREVKEIGHIIWGIKSDENYEYSLNDNSSMSISEYLKQAGMKMQEALAYGKQDLYAWHISDLVVFDKPMELNDFGYYVANCKKRNYGEYCLGSLNEKCEFAIDYKCRNRLYRPPQSYQYVEVGE